MTRVALALLVALVSSCEGSLECSAALDTFTCTGVPMCLADDKTPTCLCDHQRPVDCTNAQPECYDGIDGQDAHYQCRCHQGFHYDFGKGTSDVAPAGEPCIADP